MRGIWRLSGTALAGTVVGALIAIGALSVLGGSGALAAEDDLVVTGPGRGGAGGIRTFGPTGADGGVSFGSERSDVAGATVAAGDINGDGTPEIVTGTGPGSTTRVQVWSKDGKTLVAQVEPFPGFGGGVFVATANVDETPQQEVIVAAGPGGGPHVKALRLNNGALQDVYSFMAYEPNFRGGVFVAGSGGRIITAPGAGGGPHVKVFRILLGELSVADEWMAYEPKFTGGVRVAAGPVRDTADVDIITAAGPGGGPHVKLWSLEGEEGPGVMAYDPKFTGGVFVGVGHDQHLITGAGAGGGPHVKVMTVSTTGVFATPAQLMAYPQTFTGGVHVAGFPATTDTGSTTTTTEEECAGVGPICLPGDEETTTTTGGTGTTTTTTTSTSTTTTTTAPTTTTTTTTADTTTTTEAECPTAPLCP